MSGLAFLILITANGNCYENRALTPSTFRPMPSLLETTELAYLTSRPILWQAFANVFFFRSTISNKCLIAFLQGRDKTLRVDVNKKDPFRVFYITNTKSEIQLSCTFRIFE